MKQTIVEVTCDNCRSAIGHYPPGDVNADIRADDGVVTKDKKHLCDSNCLQEYRLKPNSPQRPELRDREWITYKK